MFDQIDEKVRRRRWRREQNVFIKNVKTMATGDDAHLLQTKRIVSWLQSLSNTHSHTARESESAIEQASHDEISGLCCNLISEFRLELRLDLRLTMCNSIRVCLVQITQTNWNWGNQSLIIRFVSVFVWLLIFILVSFFVVSSIWRWWWNFYVIHRDEER